MMSWSLQNVKICHPGYDFNRTSSYLPSPREPSSLVYLCPREVHFRMLQKYIFTISSFIRRASQVSKNVKRTNWNLHLTSAINFFRISCFCISSLDGRPMDFCRWSNCMIQIYKNNQPWVIQNNQDSAPKKKKKKDEDHHIHTRSQMIIHHIHTKYFSSYE